MFTIKKVNWQDHQQDLSAIRTEVFIKEQHVPVDLEWDGLDYEAIHVLVLDSDNHPIGTGRLLSTGQIGRMAVLQPWRRQGVGSAILDCLLEAAREHAVTPVFLNAQVSAIAFYQRHGFTAEGDVFDDAGIPHRRMILDKTV